MRKVKFAILTLLVALLSCCCFAFIACNDGGRDEATKYKITWTVNENVTVAVDGYAELPTELADGTEVTFTVTPKPGFAVSSVAPSATVKKDGDKYKFTVNKDLEIRVNAREIVNSLTVVKPTKMEYYAGDKLDTKGMKVTVNYATNRSEETTDYIIEYATGGEAFALGDKGFKVTYGGVSEDIAFDKAIVGKVTLDLYGGVLADEDIAKLQGYTGYAYDQTKGIISWTFDKAIEADIALPTPSKTVNGAEFPFIRWSGVTDNKVAKDTVTSVNIVAMYETVLVKIDGLEFTRKQVTETVEGAEKTVMVPYLIIDGEFIAATSAYLFLYEGNAEISLKGDTVTKNGDVNEFTLEFDLRKLVDARADWTEENGTEVKDGNFMGKWMDIRFCAELDGRTEIQEIDLNKYAEDFVDVTDNVVAKHGDEFYQFSYRTYTPKAGDGINGIEGATYEGTEKLLKLVYESAVGVSFTGVTLEVRDREVEGEDGTKTQVPTAYVVIAGEPADPGLTKADVQKAVEDMYVDIESTSWNKLAFDKIITVNDDLTFTVALSLDKAAHDTNYFMHAPKAGNNFAIKVTPGSVKAGDFSYTLSNNVAGDWTNGLVWLYVRNTTLFTAEDNVIIEVDGDKAYIVVGGFAGTNTAEQIKAKLTQFDFEPDGDSANKVLADLNTVTVTVDEATGKYTLKVQIPELKSASYWLHAKGLMSGDNGDLHPNNNLQKTTVGDVTYSYDPQNKDWGTAHLFKVEVKSPVTVESVALEVEGEGEAAKLNYVVEYSYEKDYTEAELRAMMKINFGLQCNNNIKGGGWAYQWFDDKITLNIDTTNKKVTVKIDISALSGEYGFTTKLSFDKKDGDRVVNDNSNDNSSDNNPADFKPGIDSFTGPEVEFNGKKYQLKLFKGSGEGSEYWGCVGLEVSAIA